MECRVCCEERKVDDMWQIFPCLHIFCSQCVIQWNECVYKRNTGQNANVPNGKEKAEKENLKYVANCLAVDCFSQIKSPSSERLSVRNCDNQDCCRRLSLVPLQHLSCLHDICVKCFQEANIEFADPRCPVENCGHLLCESDDEDWCNGECVQPLVRGRFVIMRCCKARLCFSCFEKMFHQKPDLNAEFRCTGDCLIHKNEMLEDDQGWPLGVCQGEANCKGAPLSGFPSKYECEHDVCLNCIERMLKECQASNRIPHCPLKTCETPYCMESTFSLKALLPNFRSFFDGFVLDDVACVTVDDPTTSTVKVIPNFGNGHRYLCAKLDMNFDGLVGLVEFDRKGTVAEFFREVRRELGIISVDKIYGYYLRQAKPDDVEEDTQAGDKLSITVEVLGKPVEDLGLTTDCTLIVDTRGIVRPKETH